jgi:ribonuclease VapC
MTVFDSSALLAYLFLEPGAGVVRDKLVAGGRCSAANWSEVAQKSIAKGLDWSQTRLLLLSFGLVIEPVTTVDAELAARLWIQGEQLSLADRLCLALGARLEATILTCDREWDGRAGVTLVR